MPTRKLYCGNFFLHQNWKKLSTILLCKVQKIAPTRCIHKKWRENVKTLRRLQDLLLQYIVSPCRMIQIFSLLFSLQEELYQGILIGILLLLFTKIFKTFICYGSLGSREQRLLRIKKLIASRRFDDLIIRLSQFDFQLGTKLSAETFASSSVVSSCTSCIYILLVLDILHATSM